MPVVLLDVPPSTRLSVHAAGNRASRPEVTTATTSRLVLDARSSFPGRSVFAAGKRETPNRISREGAAGRWMARPGIPAPRTFVVNTAGLLARGSTPIRLAFPVTNHQ